MIRAAYKRATLRQAVILGSTQDPEPVTVRWWLWILTFVEMTAGCMVSNGYQAFATDDHIDDAPVTPVDLHPPLF